MLLPYKVWTDEEVAKRNVAEAGDYAFFILNAESKKAKSGADMLVLDLEFTNKEGQVRTQKDWIVFIPGMDWKLRHICKSCGIIEAYDLHTLTTEMLIRKKGKMQLGIKDYTANGVETKVNFVKDYLFDKAVTEDAPEALPFNDDIPM